MYFCENCGAKLAEDSRFCEQCGFAVSTLLPSNENLDIYLFSKGEWRQKWRDLAKTKSLSLGILLTNTCGCPDVKTFYEKIEEYIGMKAQMGIHYFLLDMANEAVCYHRNSSSLSDILDVLRKIYGVIVPEYLLIVGDRNAVESARWENGAKDSDKFVDSDLPYITLDEESPWDGRSYDFERSVCVGRIPSRGERGFPEAIAYFRHATRNTPAMNERIYGYSLSAESWNSISQNIHQSAIQNGEYFCSPPKVRSDFETNACLSCEEDPNLLYFNLHGSQRNEFWYGENKFYKPEAFSSGCLKNIRSAYMIGTEACYGAKPVLTGTETMLSFALRNGCLAFLGSTQIAYGSFFGKCALADVVVGEYIRAIAAGKTAGEGFRMGLVALNRSKLNDTGLKTLAEFALYGDPSFSLIVNQEKSIACNEDRLQRSIRVAIPDVCHAVHLRLAKVSSEIAKKLEQYIEIQHPSFTSITPNYYNARDIGGYQAIYYRRDEYTDHILKVYFDEQGSIGEVFVSK